MNIEELKAAELAAYEVKRAADKARADELAAATSVINAKHSAAIATAGRAFRDAEQAVKDAIGAAASHPWEGRKVFKLEEIRERWSSRVKGHNRVDGIVQVCRVDTVFAENVSSYSRPSLGAAFVRFLKKDGTPSLKFERNWHDPQESGWQLADEGGAA